MDYHSLIHFIYKMTAQVYTFTRSVCEFPLFHIPHSCQHLIVFWFSFFFFLPMVSMKWYPIVLICISLLSNQANMLTITSICLLHPSNILFISTSPSSRWPSFSQFAKIKFPRNKSQKANVPNSFPLLSVHSMGPTMKEKQYWQVCNNRKQSKNPEQLFKINPHEGWKNKVLIQIFSFWGKFKNSSQCLKQKSSASRAGLG